uniref:Uncharacterized protein n=1 Tax=viral metagenome TaxID=1070528 RepID=A0A6C0CLU3_9ZZZZ
MITYQKLDQLLNNLSPTCKQKLLGICRMYFDKEHTRPFIKSSPKYGKGMWKVCCYDLQLPYGTLIRKTPNTHKSVMWFTKPGFPNYTWFLDLKYKGNSSYFASLWINGDTFKRFNLVDVYF